MENIKLSKDLERIIAHDEDLEGQLGDITFGVFTKATAKFAPHRKTGEHRITQTKGRVDHFVNIVGPAAAAIELGHHDARTGKFIEGLHILRDSL